jgi:predicted AAA+ superfamily ATPase
MMGAFLIYVKHIHLVKLELNSEFARMIVRYKTLELDELLSSFPAVVLIGPRQVGKTTLAYELVNQQKALYLDLEAPSDLAKLNQPEDYLIRHSDKLVILDEIHRVPNLFPVLRGLIDKYKREGNTNGSFLLLGSASIELLKQSGETLAGRIGLLELNPFNILEAENDVEKLWVRGGFPDSFLAKNDRKSLLWRQNFIKTYLERDIPQFGPRIPAATLRRFWTMLAHEQSNPFNASKLARSLGVDSKTISSYLDLLIDLLLVRRLNPWHRNVGKRLVKSPKIYLRDTGIANTLLNISGLDDLMGHPSLGASWEAFVIENIASVIPEGVEMTYYRTGAGAEIDLILSVSSKDHMAIEIKRSMAPKVEKGFYIGSEDIRAKWKFLVYPGTDNYKLANGVEVISLLDIINKIQSICGN